MLEPSVIDYTPVDVDPDDHLLRLAFESCLEEVRHPGAHLIGRRFQLRANSRHRGPAGRRVLLVEDVEGGEVDAVRIRYRYPGSTTPARYTVRLGTWWRRMVGAVEVTP